MEPSAPRPPAPVETTAAPRVAEAGGTIRIPVQLVDRLMTLAGELVLVRNQALRSVDPRDAGLRPFVQRLDAVTGDLQEAVMRTRMQPVGNLFGKFPRMVRDLAKQVGKQIELEVTGAEVELDKTILESLSDPLTHLIRNACDHGIETPADRAAAGKPTGGKVTLAARHRGGQIFVEVRDDGRGIAHEAVRRKALQKGLRTEAELTRLSERELLGLILLPGFSTAAAVTDLSGRGVGMDVVKTNLDRLAGTLEIASTPGRGTTFSLQLPLTLAIIPCLMVTAGGERYALPQKDLEELVCVHPRQTRTRIEVAFDQEVVRLRDRLLPLVRLDEVLARDQPFDADTRAEIVRKHKSEAGDGAPGLTYFAVVKSGSHRFGLVVENILSTEEIVVKPMHSAMKGLACFTGATILGDGRVALILGVEGIARHAGVRFERAVEKVVEPSDARLAEAQRVLLFQYGPREQFAVPLATIRRLVQIRTDRIERVGDREFVSVDGVLTRVLRLDRMFSVSGCEERGDMLLLLPKGRGRPLGLLISEVIDTETWAGEIDPDAYRGDGLVGSALVRGRMTLVLDLYRLADLVEDAGTAKQQPTSSKKRDRVLLVEDTQFFRHVVKGYLEAAGFEVATAENGAEGLARLDQQTFDLIVSDIEMPVMNGWDFARALRQRPDGADIPLLALTTLNKDADLEKAAACGFDRHEVKIDRDRFLAAVSDLLALKRGDGKS